MICAWQCLLNILPQWMRVEVDKLGRDSLQDLRLRINTAPELKLSDNTVYLHQKATISDLIFIINAATKYSPWIGKSAVNGYITAPGGHRIGICGKSTGSSGSLLSVHGITSVCIRISRDFPGIADGVPSKRSILIIGKPGSGKTTLLRDIIRYRSTNDGENISVVDEREEIFPRWEGKFCFPTGRKTDVLSGYSKSAGLEAVLRTMGPDTVAIDEITAAEDCKSLLTAGWCGVYLLATAHAGDKKDFLQRPIYKPIVESGLFDTLITLREDKSWYVEGLCV